MTIDAWLVLLLLAVVYCVVMHFWGEKFVACLCPSTERELELQDAINEAYTELSRIVAGTEADVPHCETIARLRVLEERLRPFV